jgi:opacity protein-like surface antigen
MNKARDDRSLANILQRTAAFAACAFLTVVSTDIARAADWPGSLPVLRGSYSAVDWSGFSLGGQFGVGNSDTDFGDSTHNMVAYLLRNTTIEAEQSPSNWTTLPTQIGHLQSYGGFFGYNVQWDRLVFGIEAAYNRVSASASSASDSIGRQFATSDGFNNTVTVAANSSIKLNDYGTVRGRVGYAIGQFLPFATMGVAVGRFDYAVTAIVNAGGTPTSGTGQSFCLAGGPYPNCTAVSQTDQKDNAIVAGFEAGLGMDVALTPNIFLRGEYEFIAFAPVHGIRVNINTARAGIGIKF